MEKTSRITIKLYDYEHDNKTLVRGYSFTLKLPCFEPDWNVFCERVCSQFQVDENVSEYYFLDLFGKEFDSLDQLKSLKELELYILPRDEPIIPEIPGRVSSSSSIESKERNFFDMSLFSNSKVRQNVPRKSHNSLLEMKELKGPWNICLDEQIAILENEQMQTVECWRQILPNDCLQRLKGKENLFKELVESRWLILLCHGGGFAGIFFDGEKVLEKKSLRKYVTRKKQGKRQVNQDRRANTAASAGSALRRAQEKLLEEEIAEIMCKWQELIKSCDLLFVHAPGMNRSYIYKEQALSVDDPRIRNIPITTRTANLREVSHIWWKLSTLKCSFI